MACRKTEKRGHVRIAGVPPSALADPLAGRDGLLSRLAGVVWPYGALLDALELASHLDVLDIGAGDGGLLRELARRGHTGRLEGLDPKPENGVRQGTAEGLPYPAETFDAVFLLRVLAHLPEPEKALAEARRVLKPDGRIIVAAHGADHLRALWTVLGQVPAAANASGLDTRLPIQLDAADAQAVAQSYSQSIGAAIFPLADQLHLAINIKKKAVRSPPQPLSFADG